MVDQMQPDWNAQIAQGQQAQSQLANVLRGPQMQQAMQLMNARMAPIQNQGRATRNANPFEAFAQMAQNSRGRREMGELEAQGAQLAQQAQQGRAAELSRQDANRMQQQDFQRDIAQEARDDAANNMRGSMQVWANDEGDSVEFAMTSNGPVDSQGNPVDLGGFGPPEKKGMGKYGIGGLGVKDRSNAAKAFSTIKKIDNIKSVAKDFTQEDVASMNKAGLNTAIKTMTPAAFENYVQNNWKNLSPRVKTLWTKMKSLGAEQRHALFGAALTKQEGASAEGFIVGAEGLNFGDGQRRLDNLFDDTAAQLYGYDKTMGTSFLDAPELVNYERYQDPAEQAAPSNIMANAPTDPAERLAYLRQMKAQQGAQQPAQPQPALKKSMSRQQQRQAERSGRSARNYQQDILDQLESQDRAAGLTKTLNRRRGPQNANR